MSDSSDENLSDLEEQQAVDGSRSDKDEAEKPELKGILNDVEETVVSWKDLVSFISSNLSTCCLFFFVISRVSLMCCVKLARI